MSQFWKALFEQATPNIDQFVLRAFDRWLSPENRRHLPRVVCPGEAAAPSGGFRIIRWHKIVAVFAGEGRVHYPGGTLAIRAGQIGLIPPHFPHGMEPILVRGKYVHLFMAPKTREMYYNAQVWGGSFQSVQSIRGGERELKKSQLILSLADELIALPERRGPLCEGLTLSLLAVLHEEFLRGQRPTGSVLIHRCLSYVEQELSDPSLSVTRIAEELRVHPDHLSRAFHAETGTRLVSHIQSCRVQLARELLAGGKLYSTEVGHLAGFSDSGYFTKVFRKLVGTTPSEYRQRGGRVR